jgi:hypothetical protein
MNTQEVSTDDLIAIHLVGKYLKHKETGEVYIIKGSISHNEDTGSTGWNIHNFSPENVWVLNIAKMRWEDWGRSDANA